MTLKEVVKKLTYYFMLEKATKMKGFLKKLCCLESLSGPSNIELTFFISTNDGLLPQYLGLGHSV